MNMKYLIPLLLSAPAIVWADPYCVPGFSPPCSDDALATAQRQYESRLNCVYQSRTIDVRVTAAAPIKLTAEQEEQCETVREVLDMEVVE